MYARCGRSSVPGRAATHRLPATRQGGTSDRQGHPIEFNVNLRRLATAGKCHSGAPRRSSKRCAQPTGDGPSLTNGEIVRLAELTAEQVVTHEEQLESAADVARRGQAE